MNATIRIILNYYCFELPISDSPSSSNVARMWEQSTFENINLPSSPLTRLGLEASDGGELDLVFSFWPLAKQIDNLNSLK